ncbi:MAG: ABC transporter substrate-binding protein [Pasteurellaceae bacterium]|nr:ABC transporter substrate-binding protein [Pasteurellaceae bacterium]
MKLKTLFTLAFTGLMAASSIHAETPKQEQPKPTQLNVITFSGGWNLPVWIAERQGFFKDENLKVRLDYTPNSKFLAKGLYNNDFQIAIAGMDNVIAYRENQGALKLDNADFFAFMGVDNGLLSLVSQPTIKVAQDLKGKNLSVDALTTGYAFVLRNFLAENKIADNETNISSIGSTNLRFDALVAGKTDATLLRTPMNIQAQKQGFNILATGKTLGDFQGTVGVAKESWVKENQEALVKFIKAYRKALAWAAEPQNKGIAEAILIANDKDMTPELAPLALQELLQNMNAEIDEKGVVNVMNLRAKFAEPKKELKDAKKYYNTHYYDLAK